MRRTILSFRLALAEEKSEWGDYRKHLGRRERKDFDDIFMILRLYMSACSGSVSLIRIHHPIFVKHNLLLPSLERTLMEIAPQIGIMREQII